MRVFIKISAAKSGSHFKVTEVVTAYEYNFSIAGLRMTSLRSNGSLQDSAKGLHNQSLVVLAGVSSASKPYICIHEEQGGLGRAEIVVGLLAWHPPEPRTAIQEQWDPNPSQLVF